MRKSGKTNSRTGQVRINLSSSDSDAIKVTVVRACNNPLVLKLADEILENIVQQQPKVVIQEVGPESLSYATGQRRGGPVGMPEEKRLEIVADWFQVRGRVDQVVFARSQGISASTLRRWIRQLHQAGKL